MIKKIATLTFGLFLGSIALAPAHEDHKHKHDEKHADHDHKHEALVGPTGGRILHGVEPHAEFFVNKDNKVEIRFINDDNKVIDFTPTNVSVTTGTRKNPVKMTFVKQGNKLVSEQTIPSGNNNPTVVQIKTSADARVVSEKFNLNLDKCPETGHPEYALGEHADDHKH